MDHYSIQCLTWKSMTFPQRSLDQDTFLCCFPYFFTKINKPQLYPSANSNIGPPYSIVAIMEWIFFSLKKSFEHLNISFCIASDIFHKIHYSFCFFVLM
jgi:hypothetical protein